MDLAHLTTFQFSSTSEVIPDGRAVEQPFELRDDDGDPALADSGWCVPTTTHFVYVRRGFVNRYLIDQSSPRDVVSVPDRMPPISQATKFFMADGSVTFDAGAASVVPCELSGGFDLCVVDAPGVDEFVCLSAVCAIGFPL